MKILNRIRSSPSVNVSLNKPTNVLGLQATVVHWLDREGERCCNYFVTLLFFKSPNITQLPFKRNDRRGLSLSMRHVQFPAL